MLPTPETINESEYWDKYFIKTKTFNLESVEKPDMSRYLVHLTGKGELLKIIKGRSKSKGYLKASTPHYDKRPNTKKIVCFSESPIYALDFFRFKSKSRWENNHMYGIGFFKLDLLSLGVRPIIHTDDELSRTINHLHHSIKDNDLDLSTLPTNYANKIKFLINQIYNLNFPLMEEHKYQGFSWEKEWRLAGGKGLTFDHELIKIICCPIEEKDEIIEELGDQAKRIQFYSNFDEYNEVTDFLKRRKAYLRFSGLNKIGSNKDIKSLLQLKKLTEMTIHNLEKYSKTMNRLSKAKVENGAKDFIKELKKELPKIDKQIGKIGE